MYKKFLLYPLYIRILMIYISIFISVLITAAIISEPFVFLIFFLVFSFFVGSAVVTVFFAEGKHKQIYKQNKDEFSISVIPHYQEYPD